MSMLLINIKELSKFEIKAVIDECENLKSAYINYSLKQPSFDSQEFDSIIREINNDISKLNRELKTRTENKIVEVITKNSMYFNYSEN